MPKLTLLNLAARIHDEFLLKTDEIPSKGAPERERAGNWSVIAKLSNTASNKRGNSEQRCFCKYKLVAAKPSYL